MSCVCAVDVDDVECYREDDVSVELFVRANTRLK